MSGICLTLDQEAELLKKWDKAIQRIAYRIQYAINRIDKSTHEDLMQEGRIAMLQHIRSIDDESNVGKGMWHVRTAMFNYTRSMALVYVPQKKYTTEIRKYTYARKVALEELPSRNDESDIEFNAEYQDFLSRLPKTDRIAFQMKACGFTQREITRRLNLGYEQAAGRKMKKLRAQYMEYIRAGNAAEKSA